MFCKRMFLFLPMESLKIVRYWKANKVDVFNTEYKFERNERPTEKT